MADTFKEDRDRAVQKMMMAPFQAELDLARLSGIEAMREAAVRELMRRVLRYWASRDRAAAAGRDSVASHRQSDGEAMQEAAAALKTLEVK